MAVWSFAPWLIALVIAAGLGGFGWFSDARRRRNPDERPYENSCDAEQSPYHDER